MSYTIHRTVTNGYRCGCCIHEWDREPEVVKTLQEALVPVVTHEQDEDGNGETWIISVRDELGATVAYAWVDQCLGKKYIGYRHWRWVGHINGERFEVLHGANPGETWAEMCSRIAALK